jgi:hypothetical protein
LSEHVSSTCYQDFLFAQLLHPVPPFTHQPRQPNAQKCAIECQYIFPTSLSDQELRKCYAETRALLAIGMAILDVVVPHLFIGKRFVRFDNLYPFIIDGFHRFVQSWIWIAFVRMHRE